MDGTSSYPIRQNSRVSDCRWDFADGSEPSNCCWASHVYQQPGHYTVRFTVTDEQGVSNTKAIGVDAF